MIAKGSLSVVAQATKVKYVTWADMVGRALTIQREYARKGKPKVYGVPRGGCAVAALIGRPVDDPTTADLIVDDLIDSGATRDRYRKQYPDTPFVALYDKQSADKGCGWLVFPWEQTEESSIEDAVTRVLQFMGEDPTRDGLTDTPARAARAYREMTEGYGQDPAQILSAQFDVGCDEMVVVRNIPFYSLCEHHMLPFHGTATVGYLPGARVVGLSKLARLVRCYAARLQVQERMTEQIAQAMIKHLEPLGAGVVVEAVHTCMGMRGIRSEGSTMTSCLLGKFRDEAQVRAEFLALSPR